VIIHIYQNSEQSIEYRIEKMKYGLIDIV